MVGSNDKRCKGIREKATRGSYHTISMSEHLSELALFQWGGWQSKVVVIENLDTNIICISSLGLRRFCSHSWSNTV